MENSFKEALEDIVAQKLVPTVRCTSCGYLWTCFEGSVAIVEKIYKRPCDKCGGINEFLGTDTEL